MPAGERNSSETRVVPVFEQLAARSDDWVAGLLRLAEGGNRPPDLTPSNLAFVAGFWGMHEKGMPPPPALLEWLVEHVTEGSNSRDQGDMRRRLLARDAEAIAEAKRRLASERAPRAWYVFEGLTYPDATIEAPDALIVIEGKRTESGPTTATTWMEGRHQIWRHMDAAWEQRRGRQVFRLFIVEGAEPSPRAVPGHWQEAFRSALSSEAINTSFPHRSSEERSAITQGFLGGTTWQNVCHAFGIPFERLPDRLNRQ